MSQETEVTEVKSARKHDKYIYLKDQVKFLAFHVMFNCTAGVEKKPEGGKNVDAAKRFLGVGVKHRSRELYCYGEWVLFYLVEFNSVHFESGRWR